MRVRKENIAKYLALTIQNFASKWRWGKVCEDSFLFYKAHTLWFSITFATHLLHILSLFIYDTHLLQILSPNFIENYLQLSRTGK